MGVVVMRVIRVKRSLLGVLSAIIVLLGVLPQHARAQDDVTWLLNQINALRASLGLHAYSLNPQLSAAAQQHSQYMADTCDVSHTQANGSTATSRARANGYTGGWIGENIYSGQNARAQDAWNFWTNSGIHYQGLTHKIVNEIGIGVAYGGCGQGFTLVFGHRDDVSAPPAVPSGDGGAPVDEPAPQAYIPPPPTNTPTPTIPTLTPSATWTLTPTHTATAAGRPTRAATLTPTPLVLPTVPAVDAPASATPAAVARVPSASATPIPPPVTPTLARATPDVPGQAGGRDLPGWVPFGLVGAALVLGAAGVAVLLRAR